MATTPQMRKALDDGRTIRPLIGWAKDEPELSYEPTKPRDLYPWKAPDGRRYRACQLRIV